MKNKLKTFFLLSSLTTFSMYAINKIITSIANSKNNLTINGGKFFEWRFGNIYYTKQGKGKPILLIHDLFVGSSSFEWDKIVKSLSKSNTVYTLDLLGCGLSEKPNITYTNYVYVQLINDFIKNIINQKTDIIVTGESSSFVIMGCHLDKELYNKIMIINPSNIGQLKTIPTKKTKALKFLIDTPIIGTLIYNMIFSKKNIKDLFLYKYFFKNHLVSNKYINAYYSSSHIGNGKSKYLFSSMKGKYTNANIIHALKATNHSIFIISSLNNNHSTSIVEEYVHYNPAIEYAYINQAKYLPQLELPNIILEYIKMFFN